MYLSVSVPDDLECQDRQPDTADDNTPMVVRLGGQNQFIRSSQVTPMKVSLNWRGGTNTYVFGK